MSIERIILHCIETIVVLYSVGHLAFNLVLILAGFRSVLDSVQSTGFHGLDLMDAGSASVPSIAVLVPAYNEGLTIVESVTALTETDYPDLEIVVVNDGSSDDTMEQLRQAFDLHRRDIPVRQEIPTAEVRGTYETPPSPQASVRRLVVVDKENGGRSDALNAGLNTCISPYFVTIDADSLLDPLALKQLVRLLQEDPDIAAAGGSIGVVNACDVEKGQVTRTAISRNYVVLCQTLEYVRSFSLARTGFARINSLVILSGAFLIMRRQLGIEVGGFLTGRSKSRWLLETVGAGAKTICEDMEIIVRIHRYLRDHGRKGRIVHAPVSVCWTEVPDNAGDLAKQRNRWHRGLMEILRHHRKMIFNPSYGRIGLVSMPYFATFELLGPYVESLGWIVLPILLAFGLADPLRVGLVMAIALGAGILQSLLAVLCATWLEPVSPTGHHLGSLLRTDRWRDRLLLVIGSFATETGYRQATVWWRLRGTWDYLRGRTSWDKFERRGFRTATSLLAAACLLGAVATSARAQLSAGQRELLIVGGVENRSYGTDADWEELLHKWQTTPRTAWMLGCYRRARGDARDLGVQLGVAARPWTSGGFGIEVRAGGGDVGARWTIAAESEFAAVGSLTTANRIRFFRFRDLSLLELAPGAVFYFRGSWWLQGRVLFSNTRFDGGESDWLVGGQAMLSAALGASEVRVSASTGAESFLAGEFGPRQLRSRSYGVAIIQPVVRRWSVRTGVHHWVPERGSSGVFVHLGVTYRYGAGVSR